MFNMKLFLIALLSIVTITVKAQTAVVADQDTTVYKQHEVTVKPMFNGSSEGFLRFLIKTVRYPAAAREHNIQGKVYVAFIVEKDGNLSNFRVTKKVSKDLDEETLRVMKVSPPWQPAKNDDKPVRCWVEVPISYSLGFR
jgi:protein TonB